LLILGYKGEAERKCWLNTSLADTTEGLMDRERLKRCGGACRMGVREEGRRREALVMREG
jgi:hypothetical protein